MSIEIKTKYIRYDHSGTGVRHHHYAAANPTGHTLPIQTADENEGGNRIASAPEKYTFNDGQDLNFAFMSINGTKDGNIYYTTAGDYYYNVGTQNIDILAVYAPASGTDNSKGDPGIWVDAFNIDAGNFSDDLHFISVFTPPDNVLDVAKTNEANQEGDIATLTSEHIKASGIIDGTAQFLAWKQIMPVQKNEKSSDIDLAQNESDKIWIAFYQSKVKSPIPSKYNDEEVWLYVSDGVKVGNLGFVGDKYGRHPVDPYYSLATRLLTSIAILSLSENMSSSLKERAINLAGDHLIDIAQSIKEMKQ